MSSCDYDTARDCLARLRHNRVGPGDRDVRRRPGDQLDPLARPRALWFRRLCYFGAALLVLLALVGSSFGFYLFLPAAALLALAPSAIITRGRTKPSTRGPLTVGVVGGVVMLGWLSLELYTEALSDPYMLIAYLDPSSPLTGGSSPLLEGDGSGIGYGAVSVSQGGPHAGQGPTLSVGLDPDLSDDQEDAMEARLASLPGVIRVHSCGVWDLWTRRC